MTSTPEPQAQPREIQTVCPFHRFEGKASSETVELAAALASKQLREIHVRHLRIVNTKHDVEFFVGPEVSVTEGVISWLIEGAPATAHEVPIALTLVDDVTAAAFPA